MVIFRKGTEVTNDVIQDATCAVANALFFPEYSSWPRGFGIVLILRMQAH